MATMTCVPATVTIGNKQFPFQRRWDGMRLLTNDLYLAFDTETEVVDLKREIPRLALAAASAGDNQSCLIAPAEVGRFILAHKGLHFVSHNAAFDFWAVDEHLRQHHDAHARRAWWEIAERNRLHDSMLLDMLVCLAEDDSFPSPRDLAMVAKQYAGIEITKDDPCRLRYGEIIGADWDHIDESFFMYAIKDAIATRLAYQAIRQRAKKLADNFGTGDVRPDARQQFGLLTEAIQVKKAIALAQITRNGMRIDQASLKNAEGELRQRLDEAVVRVRETCPTLFKTDHLGNLIYPGKARVPSKNAEALRTQLRNIMESLKSSGIELKVPVTKKEQELSTSRKVWQEFESHHPFLHDWIEIEESTKLLQFFNQLDQKTIHPSYSTMVRTGRTSCTSPNVQQIPRDGNFRQAFVAAPGHFLLAVDYSFIELRTLAAHALHRYGHSDMAEVIKAGVDPHAHTAAMMSNLPCEEFLSWKGNDTVVETSIADGREVKVRLRDRYDAARQAAKAINFGVPGGLGAQRLMEYARNTYKVSLTLEEAQHRRQLLTTQVYKELDLYLSEDAAAILARNLHTPIREARNEMGDMHLSCVRKVLAGDPRRTDGKAYQPSFVSRIWSSLQGLNRNPDLKEALEKREPSEALAAKVCHAGVATLTGRIRGRVRYSQARNTPFQGLAADGAALALFKLVQEGFRVVGFVHDEILVELPDEGGYVSGEKVQRIVDIMCHEMERVLVGEIPVACETALSDRWNKKAKLIQRDGRVYPWREQTSETAIA